MISIQISSDLHIDTFIKKDTILNDKFYKELSIYIFPEDVNNINTILIIAGDITRVSNYDVYVNFLKNICSRFKQVIVIPGNHEYYSNGKNTIEDINIKLKEINISNLVILNDTYIDIGENIRIYGTVLWSYIPKFCFYKQLPIFYRKDNKVIPVDVNYWNELNSKCIKNMDNIILKSIEDKKQLVCVSHYSPSIKQMNISYKLSPEKYYYGNELDHYLNKFKIPYFISGHTHVNFDIVTKYGCRFISNCFRGSCYDKNKILNIKDTQNNIPKYVQPPKNIPTLDSIKNSSAQCSTDFDNWLINKKIMTGPYPYLDGINYPTIEDADKHLTDLKNQNISLFICLCHDTDNPKYYPKFSLYNNNVPFYYHYPIIDGQAPDNIVTFFELVKNICNNMYKGVFIHCAGGHGRTGVLSICILMYLYNIDYEEAVEIFMTKRLQRKKMDLKLKQNIFMTLSEAQLSFVLEFESVLKSRN